MPALKSETIYESLRTAIVDGDYKPGDRLVLREVANDHGTSEIPAREALRMLEREGFVEITPYAGARVVRPSPKIVRDSIFVRAHLESLATRLAASRMEEATLDVLEAMLDEMQQAIDDETPSVYAKLNRRFHAAIVDACGNNVLASVLHNLEANQTNIQLVFSLSADRLRTSFEEHKGLVDVLRARDANAAARVALEHKISVSTDYDAVDDHDGAITAAE